MSVAVETVLDVSSMGQQAQDVYSSAPEAFKADIHLAFRSDRLRCVHDWRLLHYVLALRRSYVQSEQPCSTVVMSKVLCEPRVNSLKQCKMFDVQLILSPGHAGHPPRLTVCRIWVSINRNAKPPATLALQNHFPSYQRLVSTLY